MFYKILCLSSLENFLVYSRYIIISALLSLNLGLFRLLFCLSSCYICLGLSHFFCNCLFLCSICGLIIVLGIILINRDRSYVILSCKSFSLSLSLFLRLLSLLLLSVCLTVSAKLFLLFGLEIVLINSLIVLTSFLLELSLCLFKLLFCMSSRCIRLYLSLSICDCLLICIVCRLIEALGIISICPAICIGR